MSSKPIIYYTFYEFDVLESLARLTWKGFFRKHPKMRKMISQEVENSYHPEEFNGCKPTSLSLSDILNTKTLAWTLRRCDSQFYTMSWILECVPELRTLNIQTYSVADSEALVAAGIDCWARGIVREATLRAILKLHDFNQGCLHVLNLPKKILAKLEQFSWWHLQSKPLFSWQGARWQSENYGYFVDNCLRVADTRRFVKFLELAWQENQPVSYIESLSDGWPLSVETDPLPKFRELELNRMFSQNAGRILRFKRPCLIQSVSDG